MVEVKMARKVFIPIFCLLAWGGTEVASQCPDQGKIASAASVKDLFHLKTKTLTGERERKLTNILFLEQCIPATDCQKYQDKQDRLGHAQLYNGKTWLDVFLFKKSIFTESCKLY